MHRDVTGSQCNRVGPMDTNRILQLPRTAISVSLSPIYHRETPPTHHSQQFLSFRQDTMVPSHLFPQQGAAEGQPGLLVSNWVPQFCKYLASPPGDGCLRAKKIKAMQMDYLRSRDL